MEGNLQDLFADRLAEQTGQTHFVSDEHQAAKIIQKIIAERRVATIVKTSLSDELNLELSSIFPALGVEEIAASADDFVLQVSKADAGITTATFAIAETGTLVEIVNDDRERLISSLPPIHIALVRARDIVPSLDDAAPRLNQVYLSGISNSIVTFISGPSRTADIELRLVLGVHGPHEVHAIVLHSDRSD